MKSHSLITAIGEENIAKKKLARENSLFVITYLPYFLRNIYSYIRNIFYNIFLYAENRSTFIFNLVEHVYKVIINILKDAAVLTFVCSTYV